MNAFMVRDTNISSCNLNPKWVKGGLYPNTFLFLFFLGGGVKMARVAFGAHFDPKRVKNLNLILHDFY